MDFANILVAADLGEAAPDRVRLAPGLARRFSATITGAAAHKVPAPILVRDVSDAARQEERNEALVRAILEQAHAMFERSAGDGICMDWQAALAGPTTHLVEQARAADLVVVGRRGKGDDDPGPLGVPPGPVLMEAGRPVLVVPPRLAHLRATRIVVAWKDGPEARRAVSAALPLIRGADEVAVATVGTDGRREGVEAVAGHLARHGAHVTTHRLHAAGSEGGEILDFALRQDADLVVMGAYGHSRLREWIFGGVTREALERAGLLPDVPLRRRSRGRLGVSAPTILAVAVPKVSAALAQARCGRRHAAGSRRASPMHGAPPFRAPSASPAAPSPMSWRRAWTAGLRPCQAAGSPLRRRGPYRLFPVLRRARRP